MTRVKINSGIGKESSIELKENKIAIIGYDYRWGYRKTFYEAAKDKGYKIIPNRPLECINVIGNYCSTETGRKVIELIKKEGSKVQITELYLSTHGTPYAIDLYNSGNNIYLDNMKEFFPKFEYEENAARVSDFKELYRLNVFSKDIKIILGGCYNGAKHSEYPNPKDDAVGIAWKENDCIENIAQQLSRLIPNAKIKANRVQVAQGVFNKPVYYCGGNEIEDAF